MKKLLIVLSLLLASFTFLVSPASASECSAEDPCGTWAVVDASGLVTNIIVCQPSVCGSGTFAGLTVVFQVPANPVTHLSQGGYFNPPPATPAEPDRTVHYNDSTKTFSMGSDSFSVPVSRQEVEDSDTLTATIESQVVTFSPSDAVDSLIVLKPTVTAATGATISVTSADGTYESEHFDSPKTQEQVRLQVIANNKTKLQLHFERLYVMLFGWIL